MIRDKILEAQLLATLALGCIIAGPYVIYLIVKDEFRARM